jgi:hypothetical protein
MAKAAVELPHSKGSRRLAILMARQRHPSECGSQTAAFLGQRARAWRRRQLNCRTPKARERSQIRWRGSDILRSAAVRLPPFFCEGQGLGEGGSQELPHSKGSQTLANSMARQRHPSECGSRTAAFLSAKGRGLAKAAVELPHSKGSQSSQIRWRGSDILRSAAVGLPPFFLRRAGAWRRRQLNCRTPKAREGSQF